MRDVSSLDITGDLKTLKVRALLGEIASSLKLDFVKWKGPFCNEADTGADKRQQSHTASYDQRFIWDTFRNQQIHLTTKNAVC